MSSTPVTRVLVSTHCTCRYLRLIRFLTTFISDGIPEEGVRCEVRQRSWMCVPQPYSFLHRYMHVCNKILTAIQRGGSRLHRMAWVQTANGVLTVSSRTEVFRPSPFPSALHLASTFSAESLSRFTVLRAAAELSSTWSAIPCVRPRHTC